MIHTFDIFDTLVVRPWARPQRVFEELAERLAEEAGMATEERAGWRVGFRDVRIKAEQRAYRETPGDHATLAEIYERFDLLKAHGFDPIEVMRQEIELEVSILRPVVARVREVRDLQARGENVLFLTDMYLPPEAILQILGKCGIPATEKDLRISGYLRKAKWRGRLFHHVRKEFESSEKSFHHTGDHPRSDGWIPRLLGWKTTAVTETHPNRYESRWLKAEALSDVESVAGAMRQWRLTREFPGKAPDLISLYTDVAAPALVGFVAWILETARMRSLKRLYFMARDGYLMLEIARAIARPGDPELRYLYGSRQAFLLAGVSSFSRKTLSWIAPDGASKRLGALLQRLSISEKNIPPILKAAGFTDATMHLDARQITLFLDTLLCPAGINMLEQIRDERREWICRYFEQEGLDGSLPVAIVDIGWEFRIQRALKQILPKGSFPLFLYFGASCTRVPFEESGDFLAYLDEREPARYSRAPFQAIALIEQLMTPAPHGFTRGFISSNGHIEPDLAPASQLVDNPSIQFIRETYLALARCWMSSTSIQELAGETWKRVSIRALADFVLRPTYSEAHALTFYQVADDQNENNFVSVAKPFPICSLFRLIWMNVILKGRRGFFHRGFFWMGGSARLSSPPIRLFYRLSVWLGFYGSRFR